jgi:hypothetical protein
VVGGAGVVVGGAGVVLGSGGMLLATPMPLPVGDSCRRW